jgi:hypothetical protein
MRASIGVATQSAISDAAKITVRRYETTFVFVVVTFFDRLVFVLELVLCLESS